MSLVKKIGAVIIMLVLLSMYTVSAKNNVTQEQQAKIDQVNIQKERISKISQDQINEENKQTGQISNIVSDSQINAQTALAAIPSNLIYTGCIVNKTRPNFPKGNLYNVTTGNNPIGTCHSGDKLTSFVDKSYINSLNTRISAIENTLAGISRTGNDIYINKANVHITSGSGKTDGAVNGLGNLIIGYNEKTGVGDIRTGSHNLVLGKNNNYNSYGGLIAGTNGQISGTYATISGGFGNFANGDHSAIGGGHDNTANGMDSSVNGGDSNVANTFGDSVSGGASNDAQGGDSSISGGDLNIANAFAASISGGFGNVANGQDSSISGGIGITAPSIYCWEAANFVGNGC
jgi:hypothetical protein